MRVLQAVSGAIEHSTVTAIMGVSGCGKSTFMNVLCGRAQYGEPTGELLVNGRPAELESFRSRLGFVPQDDTVREALTVYENIRLSAQVFFSSFFFLLFGTSSDLHYVYCSDVIEMIGLGRVRDSIVGSAEVCGISGGQRKRMEMYIHIHSMVVDALRYLSRRGRTVVAVLHQPRYSMFTMLDKLLLLGVGGCTLFCGPPLKVVPYFASLGYSMRYGENPADFMLDVVSGLVPNGSSKGNVG
ncbi:P-loop containing nucleoside triphosphate hydrolase protein [Pavlovales sp. CCMP2436]|nr:P-loop containing nucleoside triphosphate hydrolase protein [Pavlovales sp. CCMP2436]